MSRMKALLEPLGFGHVQASRTYRVVRDAAWAFSSQAKSSRTVLREMRNSELGAEGFIIGTGPSLLQTDFDKLRGFPTIGLNRLYIGFDRFDFVPDRMLCINPLMINQSADALSQAPCKLFSSWVGRKHFSKGADVTYLRTMDSTSFSTAIMDCVSAGGTVTYVALQLAYWLGWSRVHLVGIDHSYELQRPEIVSGPHSTITRSVEDPNHFHPDYMPSGKDWQVPDLSQSEVSYAEGRAAFERAGRKIFDATVDGKLTVFEKSPIDLRLRGRVRDTDEDLTEMFSSTKGRTAYG